ncbi:NAD(P)H-binding protein [Geothrix sp. PMB-07]|uniref:NAD(P)H-binding protein n=1 Tax=Geothrix sp. PMB-07 TaxID=3068640 RepID=UPI002740807E|nr:NAD(P)H-binding protein [Geothrix sp. PMB-07]WLT31254.1 NAD(P)H-binding protein [Geothrix sp. PMB-07]
MKVLLFGATGMIGQGVLRECLLDPEISEVRSVVRRPSGTAHPKLVEIMHEDFLDFTAIEDQLRGLDACFFCLGVSSAGLSEAAYRRVTYDLPLAAATTLCRVNPAMTFGYISGAGADSSETGRVMWARVKGQIENALRRLPFKAVYLFRPGAIRPLHGIRSRTPLYRALYVVLGPFLPLLKVFSPDSLTTTEQLGRAMIRAGLHGAPQAVLEMRDINRL